MRQGPFELLILRSDGTAIAEHELDGKYYVAAEPGTEYKVKVVVHRDSTGSFPYHHTKVRMWVDGRFVNYWNTLTDGGSTTFSGFRKDSEALQAFTFAEPSSGEDRGEQRPSLVSVGVIKITVNETIESDRPNVCAEFDDVAGPAVATEGKKFWQQASLHTAHGRIIVSPFGRSAFLYDDVRSKPDATLEIFYHTTDMVNFLKDLHIKKEDDNALTSRVIAPPVHVDLSEVASPVRAPAETVDLTQPGTRGGAKVKRENQGGTRRAAKKPRATSKTAGGGHEVVDLT